MKKERTQILQAYRTFCRRKGIPLQVVCNRTVFNLSPRFIVHFDNENEVVIYDASFRKYRHFQVLNIVDLLAVFCDMEFALFPSKYLRELNVIVRPLSYYETFRKPKNSSSSIGNYHINYSYS